MGFVNLIKNRQDAIKILEKNNKAIKIMNFIYL